MKTTTIDDNDDDDDDNDDDGWLVLPSRGASENASAAERWRPGKRGEVEGCKLQSQSVFMGDGVRWNSPLHLAPKKQFTFRRLPILGMVFRQVRAYVAWRLRSIHPNPGPRRRDKSDEAKKARRERRKVGRQERKERKKRESQVGDRREMVVATWNVQRMSLKSREKRKAREVAAYVKECGWDVVLLSEVLAEGEGVVWMGEEEERVAFVHSERAGVLLRGDVLQAWCEEGVVKKFSKRHVSVKVKGVVLTATYLPVRMGGNAMEVVRSWRFWRSM